MLQELNGDNLKSTIDKEQECIVLCYKQICPHCKNMGKVMEKFSAKNETVNLYQIDSEANDAAMKELNIERVPCLIIVKQGAIVSQKNGLMNPKELQAFYESL